MAKKFGEHGDLVEAFLDEVRATDVDGWRRFASGEIVGRGLADAAHALVGVSMSASVRAAVYGASLAAFRSLGLTRGALPEPFGVRYVATHIRTAAMALAAGDRLAPEHRRALLAPFVAAGFQSVRDA